MPATGPARRERLAEIAIVFLKLGGLGFGGPAAHIAMMEHELVRRRAWLTREHFLDLVGATSLIPGPNSTELALHIGRLRAGWPGFLLAGACFIMPSALLALACAWGYVRYGALPQVQGLLYGVKPAIIAIAIQALWALGRVAVRTRLPAAASIASAALAAGGAHELALLFGAGAVVSGLRWLRRRRAPALGALPLLPFLLAAGPGPAATPVGLAALFLFFLKVGSVLFGSGYVLLAFLRADLVDRWGWLTQGQLLDAVAVGQMTPGPLSTTATFIGYLLAGGPGATLATLGIFLPAFVFVALSGPLVPALRRSRAASGFLDGVNAAALALMLVVTMRLAGSALVDATTVLIAIVSAVLLVAWRVSPTWLVPAAAILGLILYP